MNPHVTLRNLIPLALLAMLGIGAVASCDRADDATSVDDFANLPQPSFGNGRVTGMIRFAGEPPLRKIHDLSSCHHGTRAYQEETVVVGAEGGLRDVIVYLKDAPRSDGTSQPLLTLDQIDCRYLPHVVAVQVNQPLRISTSDPVYHNVHWVSDRNGDVNLNMPANSAAHVQRFKRPEFLRVRCDVHPWMEAFVGVMPHPFFAVTASDGSFKIDRVPPGRYTLAAWHALLGEREQQVEVAADGTPSVVLEYAPPQRR